MSHYQQIPLPLSTLLLLYEETKARVTRYLVQVAKTEQCVEQPRIPEINLGYKMKDSTKLNVNNETSVP